MKISAIGLELISRFEGFVNHVYPDIAGHPTIGFGHMIRSGERFTTITREQGMELLTQDTVDAQDAVNELVKVKLNQDQFDALCSFTYNVGANNFKHSNLLTLINEGKFYDAHLEILRWDHAGGHEVAGLLNRRHIESVLLDRI